MQRGFLHRLLLRCMFQRRPMSCKCCRYHKPLVSLHNLRCTCQRHACSIDRNNRHGRIVPDSPLQLIQIHRNLLRIYCRNITSKKLFLVAMIGTLCGSHFDVWCYESNAGNIKSVCFCVSGGDFLKNQNNS